VPAGVATGHPATAAAGLRILAAGGSAADAAVAAVLSGSAAESILTSVGGGGFATYYDAGSRAVTCLDFFCSIPGLDGDRTAGPMEPIEVNFGGVPLAYSIGGASVAVPGVPAGCGAVHERWGRLPWHQVVEPAIGLAESGAALPTAQARTLASVSLALLPGEGAGIYAPHGKLLRGGDILFHPGLARALATLAHDGPDVFYTGSFGRAIVDAVRAAGGTLGPADLTAYRVVELPVERADLNGYAVFGRDDLNGTVATLRALPPDLTGMTRGDRAVALARALRQQGRERFGDTTNVAVVDPDGNACVITTTLGLGSGVWIPGTGINLNSMLGEDELLTADQIPGRRMSSMMCPLVAVDPEGALVVAAGSAGASRIRSALVDHLLGVLVDGLDTATAVGRPRCHVVGETVHVEPGYPEDELAALTKAGYLVNRWDHMSHYFGGVSAVGIAGAAGDPRRGGAALLLDAGPPA
jgi:gamma-glutamyltranspeptidase / glutathione hydrolase